MALSGVSSLDLGNKAVNSCRFSLVRFSATKIYIFPEANPSDDDVNIAHLEPQWKHLSTKHLDYAAQAVHSSRVDKVLPFYSVKEGSGTVPVTGDPLYLPPSFNRRSLNERNPTTS